MGADAFVHPNAFVNAFGRCVVRVCHFKCGTILMGIQFVKNICAFTVEKCLYCVMLSICESVSLFYKVVEKGAFAGEALAM